MRQPVRTGRHDRRVLIIADDPAAREVYAELFAMRGHATSVATSARQGLALARRRRFAVAVLAVKDGALQLGRALRALRPELWVHVTAESSWSQACGRRLLRQRLH